MSQQDSEPQAQAPLPLALLVGLLLSASLAPLGSSMISVALPVIGEALSVDGPTLTQLLVSSYLIVSVACQGPSGKLGDLVGHRRTLRIGLLAYGAGALAGYLAPGVVLLTLARVAMALGASMLVPSVVAELRNRSAPERRARTFAVFGVAMGAAAATGPLLGGELTELFGWRSMFGAPLAQVAVAALIVELASRAPASVHAPTRRPSFDVIGALSLLVATGLLVVGLRPGGSPALALGGALGLGAFVLWELRVDQPAVDLRILRRRVFLAAVLIVGLHNMVMYPILFQLPLYFRAVGDSSPAELGRALVCLVLAMIVCTPLGARLAERLGARVVVSLACLVAGAGVLLLSRLEHLHVPLDAVGALALIGAGLGLASSNVQAVAMSAVEAHEAGGAAGLSSTLRYLGGLVGVGVMGGLLASRADLPPASQHAAPIALYAGALALALVCAQALPGPLPQAAT